MKYRHLVFILAHFLFYQNGNADPIINLWLRPYPQITTIMEKMKKPGKIARYAIEGFADYQIPSGIFATYAGYLTISDFDGQIIFPRKHEKSTVQVIITPQITPIIMLEKTIHHWELTPGAPAKMYTFEQKMDKKTDILYWDVQETPLPENNIIPLAAIVIFAKPRYFYVPPGITITDEGPNLVLPAIYAKKGIKVTKNALYVFNLSNFFGNVYYRYKKEPKRYELLFYD